MCHWRCTKDNEPLRDGMVISSMDLFRIERPDKVYGGRIGSSYMKQMGVQPANNFKSIDYAVLAKKIKKLQGRALVQDVLRVAACRSRPEGFEFFTPATRQTLASCIHDGFFQVRDEIEDDDLLLQPIPYVIIVGTGNKVFAYRRAEDIRKYTEPKLFGKWSIGVGGHIGEGDKPDYMGNALRRSVAEEVRFARSHTPPELVGSLIMRDLPVDRVHLGLVHLTYTTGDVQPRSKGLTQSRLVPMDYLLQDVHAKDAKGEYKYESWSRALIPLLPGIVRGNHG
jgi:predicted NUDIX family phosphoesterase